MCGGVAKYLLEGACAVMHVATPFYYDAKSEEELVVPAVEGTLSLLRSAAATAGVRRVVLTSSTAAVLAGSKPADPVLGWNSETDWSDVEALRSVKAFYPISKTLAERAAWDFMAREAPGFDLVVMNPTLVMGPMLQPNLGQSARVILEIADGSRPNVSQEHKSIVDVRDVAQAHIAAMDSPSASGKRFLLVADNFSWIEIRDIVRDALPIDLRGRATATVADGEPIPKINAQTAPAREILGIDFISGRDSIAATVETLFDHGFLKRCVEGEKEGGMELEEDYLYLRLE